MQPLYADIEESIKRTKDILLASTKTKIISLSTTANINNPSIVFSSIRETTTTIAGNIIFRDLSYLKQVIKSFDAIVELFFIDCEIKNEVVSLEKEALLLIKNSKVYKFKPNDITVDSLGMWINILIPNTRGKKATIVGTGNIGFKIAFQLCERGFDVVLNGRDKRKLEVLSKAIDVIKRGAGSISLDSDNVTCCQGSDILLGCTPGVAVIDKEMICSMTETGIVIDVGNGTITADGLESAAENNIAVYCLYVQGGYEAMITNFEYTLRHITTMKRVRLSSEINILSAGLIGKYGDLIVNDIKKPDRVLAVCDGKGDVLTMEEADIFIRKYKEFRSSEKV
jgi:lactate dehydrogenase-like 2-hydroxyacid dehydrogenase